VVGGRVVVVAVVGTAVVGGRVVVVAVVGGTVVVVAVVGGTVVVIVGVEVAVATVEAEGDGTAIVEVAVVSAVSTEVSVAVVNGTAEVAAELSDDAGPVGSELIAGITEAEVESSPSTPHPRSGDRKRTTHGVHTIFRLKFLNILTLEFRPPHGTVQQQRSSPEQRSLNDDETCHTGMVRAAVGIGARLIKGPSHGARERITCTIPCQVVAGTHLKLNSFAYCNVQTRWRELKTSGRHYMIGRADRFR